MDAIEAILTRPTVPQARMTGPGPDAAALERILACGAAAPDHGKLAPWRFLVVRGEDRVALGELFARAVLAANPAAPAEEVLKQRVSPLRAPVIVVVVARLDPAHPKIPVWEQRDSAAAAAQNILLAAHALGFAGKWSTGKNATDPVIKAGLGVAPHEAITGFLFLGSITAPASPSRRPALESVVATWPPPG